MNKYRTFAAVSLIVLPSILFSSPGYSTAELPAIDASANRLGQQSCPVESGSGCGGLNGLIGANPMIATIFGTADRLRREQIGSCLQFMQKFPPFGTRSG